jgi:hypothetical protein
MNFNILLIKKIENQIDMSNQFDKLCATILEDITSENNASNVYNITSLYMLIRAEHGGIIILNDKLKNEITNSETTLNDSTINKLYDLSTFTSILENINNLVSNIDFEYKKIALMFPKLINKNQIHIILIIKSIDKNNKYIKIIESAKKIYKQYEFHVIECIEIGKIINCDKMVGRKVSIKIETIPSLYMINDDNIVELPIKNINNVEQLNNLLD